MLQPEPQRAVRAATHCHTGALQTLIHGKECFILLLHTLIRIFTENIPVLALKIIKRGWVGIDGRVMFMLEIAILSIWP